MWTIDGKTIVITGATGGIGLEMAGVLASLGGRVVITGRDEARLASAADQVEARSGYRPRTYRADFGVLAEVAALAEALRRDLPRLDVLINNAGGVHARRTITGDGHEATFAINHLAPFLLTTTVLPLLRASAPARVITVASIGHRRVSASFLDDLLYTRGYSTLMAYSRSKVANIWFATELARRLEGTGVTSNALHPGRIATNIWSGAPWWAKPIIRYWISRQFISIEEGSRPVVALAIRPDLATVTGRYFESFEPVAPTALAQDAVLAARLWEISEKAVARFVTHQP